MVLSGGDVTLKGCAFPWMAHGRDILLFRLRRYVLIIQSHQSMGIFLRLWLTIERLSVRFHRECHSPPVSGRVSGNTC